MTTERKRILLVDDHLEHLELACYHLEACGYEIRTCQSGPEALRQLDEFQPHLLVLDAMMPGMTGFDVLERMRADARYRTLPVIMLTALNDTDTKVKALDYGADGFLSKPPAAIELKAKVQSLLKLQDAYQTIERERAAFTAMLIHDLRSPLTSLSMFLELLEAGSLGPLNTDQVSALESCRKSSSRLLSLVNQVLDLSKLEAGHLQLHCSEVTLRELLEQPARDTEVQARAQSVSLELEVPDPAQRVWLDAGLMEQVVTNLLENAVRHTPAEGTVMLRAGCSPEGMLIEVEDTGCGIPEAELERIFQPYHQVAVSGAKRGGTGLGLAITRLIVQAHGGSITAHSLPGCGALFRCILPERCR